MPAAAAAALPDPVTELSADEARRIALRAQGLVGAPDRRGGVPAMLRALGAVQLDTISVLARSHELVAYARLGPVGREAVEAAYWSGDAFEYWSHAASILPQTEWPWFAFRRRRFLERSGAGTRCTARPSTRSASGWRGAADDEGDRRREGGQRVVGLVGGEDRDRVAARRRRGRVRRAPRLAAGLRPRRARDPGGAAARGAGRCRVPAAAPRPGGARARRRDARRPRRLPPAAPR